MVVNTILAQACLQEFTNEGKHHANPGPDPSYSASVQCL